MGILWLEIFFFSCLFSFFSGWVSNFPAGFHNSNGPIYITWGGKGFNLKMYKAVLLHHCSIWWCATSRTHWHPQSSWRLHRIGIKICHFMCFFSPVHVWTHPHTCPTPQSIMLHCNLIRVSFMHLAPWTWFTLPSSVGPGFWPCN